MPELEDDVEVLDEVDERPELDDEEEPLEEAKPDEELDELAKPLDDPPQPLELVLEELLQSPLLLDDELDVELEDKPDEELDDGLTSQLRFANLKLKFPQV